MRIQRKRPGRTLPVLLVDAQVFQHEFDGYGLTLHARDKEGREVRTILERREAESFARYVLAELAKQRARVEAAVKVADEALG